MGQEIAKLQKMIENDYLCEKSVLYIGSFENNNHNIESFQNKFKLLESSLDNQYILKNINKYDIVFYIANDNIKILQEIREINTQIPIMVYTNEDILQITKYFKYNISHFISSKMSPLEIVLILQYELKNFDKNKTS